MISYGNGAVKEIYKDDDCSMMKEVIRFPNGDVQTTTVNDTAYYFKSSGVIQVVCSSKDADVVQYHFPNGQVEEHWKDGRKVVLYPDGTLHRFNADGSLLAHEKSSRNQVDASHSFAFTV